VIKVCIIVNIATYRCVYSFVLIVSVFSWYFWWYTSKVY